MKSKSKLIVLPFLILLFAFTSCDKEDSYYYFDEGYIESIFMGHYYDVDKTWRLCTQTWYMESHDREGNYYEEFLIFNKERNGVAEFYRNGVYQSKVFFGWYWDNLNQTRMIVDYGYNDYEVFRNIKVGTHYLEGIMNGIPVSYRPIY